MRIFTYRAGDLYISNKGLEEIKEKVTKLLEDKLEKIPHVELEKFLEMKGTKEDLVNKVKDLTEERIVKCVFNFYQKIFGDNQAYGSFIKSYSSRTGLKRFAILHAHGNAKGGNWYFVDKVKKYSVQRWVDKHDGKYASLLIFVCNPQCILPTSKKSLLVVSLGEFGINNFLKNPRFQIYSPLDGMVNIKITGFSNKK